MRKHIFAMEAAPVATPPAEPDYPVLSLEEEAVVVDEAAQDTQEIAENLAEAERVLEVSDSLEDLAVVADSIEEATPTETALIENAAQMAVAGTEVAPEQIVPAMESFKGGKIATESIRDVARRIWENIQRLVKSIWERIVGYFRVNVILGNLSKKIEAFEKKAKEAGDRKKDANKIKIRVGASALAAGHKQAKNGAQIRNNFKTISNAAEYAFKENAEHVAKKGKAIADIIKDFEPENASKNLAALRATLAQQKAPKLPGQSGGGKKVGDFTVFTGDDLMGGGNLKLKVYESDESDSPLGALDRMRSANAELDTSAKPAPGGETEIDTLTIGEVEGLLDDAKAVIKLMTEFHKGAQFTKLKSVGDELRNASSKAMTAVSKMKPTDAGQGQVIAEYRAALNFNTAYTRWVHQPAIPVHGRLLTSIRAILSVCGQSLDQYEPKNAPKKDEKK